MILMLPLRENMISPLVLVFSISRLHFSYIYWEFDFASQIVLGLESCCCPGEWQISIHLFRTQN